MEVVRVFNNELSSLYEVKPPISKAKMTQITKSAIKGIKFYKHIVQSVEKFIQKCRPEYKVPGLYVVDSIVRQSRHQFGADKDVFGPRFVKNITTTFQHLFKCPEDDRPKIIRVLNLWQKNNVFPIEVIQPLLDMGHPNSSNEWPLDTSDTTKESPTNRSKEDLSHKSSDSWKGWPQSTEEMAHDNKPYAEMSTKNLEKFTRAEMSNTVMEEETSRSSHHRNQLVKAQEETVKFNKKLLDFDYGDEEDEEEGKNEESHLTNQPNALALSMAQKMLSDPQLMKQIQQMATIQHVDALKEVPIKTENTDSSFPQDMQRSPQHPLIQPPTYQQPIIPHTVHLPTSEGGDTDERVIPDPTLSTKDLDERSLAAVMASHDRLSLCHSAFPQDELLSKVSLPDKDDRISNQDLDERSLTSLIAPPERAGVNNVTYPEPPNMIQFQFDKNGIPYPAAGAIPVMESLNLEPAYPPVLPVDPHILQNSQADEDDRVLYSVPREPPLPPKDFDERQLMPVEERNRRDRSRSRSRSRGRSGRRRSRSRSPRRKRSRSRSHSRKNRSRSRDRERIREKERERERERERRRKGIPPVKKGCVSVCSTTLWLGHVPKSCSEVDISDTFGTFGTILSIDMIPPRGCAYIVMDRRQDGYRALQKLKNVKLQGSNIKMAWAPGKGVKGKEYKDYWDVDLGVSYVPYDKIPETAEALDMLEEGGFIDEESLPEHLQTLRKQTEKAKFNNKSGGPESSAFNEIQNAPNMVPPPIMPPTSVGLPMVLPHLMQPQFGLHLPGILPPQAMVMQVPMGIPPPTPMLMVQQQSQGLLSNQPLPMVGSVPQIPPRAVAPITTLANMKSNLEPVLSSPVVPSNSGGDATPTEEDGTNVLSSKVPISVTATAASSTQPGVSLPQFNPLLGISSNRPVLSVPLPASACGSDPIPYPPPSMGFNFPPPGIRAPGQAVPANPQFPWMQKQIGSPFTESDTNHTATPSVRPVPPPQPGLPVHMYNNRSPFHDASSNMNSSVKENVGDRKPLDIDNRCSSPNQHEKMVISTDDENSMDIEYPRNDIPPGPSFSGMHEFSRGPMNIPRMRGPPGPLLPGARFPRGMHMGSPYPMRMGGPRGMGGPGMYNRMEFSPHGPRGPRHHGPRRNDGMHPRDGRDWYPRDFEGPYERDRERHFHDDWNREAWSTPDDMHDSRRNPRDHDDRHDDHWNRNDSRPPRDAPSGDRHDMLGKQRDKSNKSKANNDLRDDSYKMRSYQYTRKNVSSNDHNRGDRFRDDSERKDLEEKCPNEEFSREKEHESNLNSSSKRDKDRDSRKRSRWGRTLSEEREFQQQKRNEIEMKFQSYELSHAAQQPLVGSEATQEGDTNVQNAELDSQCPSELQAQDSCETNVQAEPENVSLGQILRETVENVVDKDKLNASEQNESSVPSETVNDSSEFESSKDCANISTLETGDSQSEPEAVCNSQIAESSLTCESISDNTVLGDNSNTLPVNNIEEESELTKNASVVLTES